MLSMLHTIAVRAQSTLGSPSSILTEGKAIGVMGTAAFPEFFAPFPKRNLASLHCLLETLRLEIEDVWSQGIAGLVTPTTTTTTHVNLPSAHRDTNKSHTVGLKEKVWNSLVERAKAVMDAFEWTVVCEILLFFECTTPVSPSSSSPCDPMSPSSSLQHNTTHNDPVDRFQSVETASRETAGYRGTPPSAVHEPNSHDAKEHSTSGTGMCFHRDHFSMIMRLLEVVKDVMREEEWPTQLFRAPSSTLDRFPCEGAKVEMEGTDKVMRDTRGTEEWWMEPVNGAASMGTAEDEEETLVQAFLRGSLFHTEGRKRRRLTSMTPHPLSVRGVEFLKPHERASFSSAPPSSERKTVKDMEPAGSEEEDISTNVQEERTAHEKEEHLADVTRMARALQTLTQRDIQGALRHAEEEEGVAVGRRTTHGRPLRPSPPSFSREFISVSSSDDGDDGVFPLAFFSTGWALVEGARAIAMHAFYTLLDADAKNVLGGASRPPFGVLAAAWRDAYKNALTAGALTSTTTGTDGSVELSNAASRVTTVDADFCLVPPSFSDFYRVLFTACEASSSVVSSTSTAASPLPPHRHIRPAAYSPLLSVMGLVWDGVYQRVGLLRVIADVHAIFLELWCRASTSEGAAPLNKPSSNISSSLHWVTNATRMSTSSSHVSSTERKEGTSRTPFPHRLTRTPTTSPATASSSPPSTADVAYLWNVWRYALHASYHSYVEALRTSTCTSCFSSSSLSEAANDVASTSPSSEMPFTSLFSTSLLPLSIFDILKEPHFPMEIQDKDRTSSAFVARLSKSASATFLTSLQLAALRVVATLSEMPHAPPLGASPTLLQDTSPAYGKGPPLPAGDPCSKEGHSAVFPPTMVRGEVGGKTSLSSSLAAGSISFAAPFSFLSSTPDFTSILLWISRRSFTLRQSRLEAFTAVRVVLDGLVDRYIQRHGPTHPNSTALAALRQKLVFVAKQERLWQGF